MRTLIPAFPLAGSACALAQPFPSRPVRFISPFPPGGAVDIITRITATGLQEALGQPVVVENRSGAGGTVGADAAARAPADGDTLFSGGIAAHRIAPAPHSTPRDAPGRHISPP